jgi:hemolysin activation/secretion protein
MNTTLRLQPMKLRQLAMKGKLLAVSLVSLLSVSANAVTDAELDAIRNNPLLDPSKQQDLLQPKVPQAPKAEAKPLVDAEDEGQEVKDSGPTFILKSVRFSKSVYLTKEDLKGLVVPLLNKKISFSGLQELTYKVSDLYRSKGVYTATAVLPQQKINNGIVYIKLVEGSLGKLKIDGQEYTDKSFIRRWLRHNEQETGIDIKVLENDVLIFNRLNDQSLQAELHAGEQFGLTDIVIRVVEPSRDQVYLFWDNYGVEGTGKNELGMMYIRHKLWLDGDKATVHALHTGNTNVDLSKGWDFVRNETGIMSLNLGYNAPIQESRWRLGSTLSSTHTDLINGDFNNIGVKGKSDRVSLDATWLAYSDLSQWVDVLVGADNTWSESEVVGAAKISDLRISQYYAGAQINWLSRLWQLSVKQVIHYAYVDDQLLPDDQETFLAKGDLSFIAQYPEYKLYSLFKAQWQNASEDGLVGSLSYSLGGPTTIRGYKPGLVSGDEGYYFNVEAHYNGLSAYGYNFDVFAFHDQGLVTSANPTEQLVAIGLGLNVSGDSMLSFNFTAAQSQRIVIEEQDDWLLYGRLTCKCW